MVKIMLSFFDATGELVQIRCGTFDRAKETAERHARNPANEGFAIHHHDGKQITSEHKRSGVNQWLEVQ